MINIKYIKLSIFPKKSFKKYIKKIKIRNLKKID